MPPRRSSRQGAGLFRQYGCSGCHGDASTVHAPPLEGLFGRPVPLADGSVVSADERYIRDSILMPRNQIAAGYPAIMPSFAGQIGEEDLMKLIAYIKSLGDKTASCGKAGAMTAATFTDKPAVSVPSYLIEEGSTLRSWLLTHDHKRIAILYTVSITLFFFVGGAAATLIRLNLVTPQGDLHAGDV